MVECDIRLVLDKYVSNFITYELELGIYLLEDVSGALFNNLQQEYELFNNSIDIEFDGITMKTKVVVRPVFVVIRFDEKSFLSTILGFKPYWDFKNFNEYISQEVANLSTTNKIHLKCDCINGSLFNGVQQPTLYSFLLDKPAGYKVFCEPETIHYKKINKPVLITIRFYLEDDNPEEVNFNGETLTFTLHLIKI